MKPATMAVVAIDITVQVILALTLHFCFGLARWPAIGGAFALSLVANLTLARERAFVRAQRGF